MPDKPIVPAVLYAAKSTEDKHGSIPDQLAKSRRLAKREGWTVVDEFFDEGFSAYSGNRGPDLEKAKEVVRALAEERGQCNFVSLHSDRVARGAGDAPGAADHLVEVVAHLRRHGVTLRTVEDDFYGDERIALLMAAVMGQRNTEDSRRKSDAVSSGLLLRAKERGMHSGPPPFGYCYAEDQSGLTPAPAEALIVRRIFNEYVAGRSLSDIAVALHHDGVKTKKGSLWRQSTVSGIVRNPVYVGKVRNNGDLFDGIHEPIIERELWERAARQVAAKPSKRGRPPLAKRHLFTGGFLRCAVCGEAMVPRTRPESGYEFYECNGRKLHNCKTGAIRRSVIDTAVLAHFEQTVLDIEATREQIVAAMQRKQSEVRALLTDAEAQAQAAGAALTRVKRDYTGGELTVKEWRELRAELEPEARAAEAEVERLRQQVAAVDADTVVDRAREELVEHLASLRAAVAGDVTAADGVEGVRAVLLRLFDSFVFHPELPDKAHVELIGSTYWIEPIVSEEAIAGIDQQERPIIDRQPLEQAGNKYGEAFRLRPSGPREMEVDRAERPQVSDHRGFVDLSGSNVERARVPAPNDQDQLVGLFVRRPVEEDASDPVAVARLQLEAGGNERRGDRNRDNREEREPRDQRQRQPQPFYRPPPHRDQPYPGHTRPRPSPFTRGPRPRI